jgi:hypothetical protein
MESKMQIDYDIGMMSKHADVRLETITIATYPSKLDFEVRKVNRGSSFAITVKTPYPIFDSHDEMQSYIRALIVDRNKVLHAEEDYMKVKGVLDAASKG